MQKYVDNGGTSTSSSYMTIISHLLSKTTFPLVSRIVAESPVLQYYNKECNVNMHMILRHIMCRIFLRQSCDHALQIAIKTSYHCVD